MFVQLAPLRHEKPLILVRNIISNIHSKTPEEEKI